MNLRRPASRGLTLIELMVVVALVVVLLALVGPSMRGLLDNQRLRGINSELVTDLQFARSEAVRRNFPVHLRFGGNAEMTCYVMFLPGPIGGCDCTRTTSSCTGLHEELKTVRLPRSLRAAMAASSSLTTIVVFDWRTGQSQPADFRVDVESLRGATLRTVVSPTGRPSVCSPDGLISQVPRCT